MRHGISDMDDARLSDRAIHSRAVTEPLRTGPFRFSLDAEPAVVFNRVAEFPPEPRTDVRLELPLRTLAN